MNDKYAAFLAAKAPVTHPVGIEPGPMPSHMSGTHAFQADVTSFLLRQGRGAAFLDTGLGKTSIQLEWCRQAAEASNGRALLLTPLAVARQIETEARKRGYVAQVIRCDSDVREGINICNYDRLDGLVPDAFGAVAMDESSILKSFNGKTTGKLIAFLSDYRFRLAATATPAPNDHTELGNHSHALGVMPAMEMLQRWFINDTSTASQEWRLKRHGEADFWDWVATWARCAETPADLGYDGSAFVLPPMRVIRHAVAGEVKPVEGSLFAAGLSATKMHGVKRQTAEARARVVAGLVNAEPDESWMIWCDTDAEADALVRCIPSAIELRGSHSLDRKEAALAAFLDGTARYLVSKPSICGAGLNFQHCARQAFVGRSFSYEAWYQAVRRTWRYGQTRPVDVHIAVAEGEAQIGRVIDRKADAHARMKRAMAVAMARTRVADARRAVPYNPTHIGRTPAWLTSAA